MDMATLGNAPRAVELAANRYTISALTLLRWSRFQAFIRDHVPRPGLPPDADAIERHISRKAWPPRIASAAWFDALDHPGCLAKLLHLAIRRHRRDFEPADALVLAEMLDVASVVRFVIVCVGGDPAVEAAPGRLTEDEQMLLSGRHSDDPEDSYHFLAKTYGWSHRTIMSLTLPQLRYYLSSGRVKDVGTRTYKSSAAARSARPQPRATTEGA